jgi:hypothetical protein
LVLRPIKIYLLSTDLIIANSNEEENFNKGERKEPQELAMKFFNKIERENALLTF